MAWSTYRAAPEHLRTYGRPRDLFEDVRYFMVSRREIRYLFRGIALDRHVQDYLMRTVLGIIQCRYRPLLRSRRLSQMEEEVETANLVWNRLENVPQHLRQAVLYARYWAECGGKPVSQAVMLAKKAYGAEAVDQMHLVMEMAKSAGYLLNFLDRGLYHVSLGRWGDIRGFGPDDQDTDASPESA